MNTANLSSAMQICIKETKTQHLQLAQHEKNKIKYAKIGCCRMINSEKCKSVTLEFDIFTNRKRLHSRHRAMRSRRA